MRIMRTYMELSAILLIILSIRPPAMAQTGPQEGLSLQEAWRLVKTQNLSLQQLEKSIRQAEEELKIQKANYLPTVAATASYTYISELAQFELPFRFPGVPNFDITAGVNNQYDAAVVLRQPLFTGFRTANLVKTARTQQDMQQTQKTILQNQLFLRVGALYYNIQLNLKQQQVLTESIDRVNLQLDRIRSFFQVERATEFDTLEVSNRILQLQSQLNNLQNAERILFSRFKVLLNADPVTAVQEISTAAPNLQLETEQAYQHLALNQRPELRQVSMQKRIQMLRENIARSAYFPQVSATATYHYARPGVNFFKDEWMTYYTIGANLQWKLWDWKQDKRKVQQAQIELQKANLQEEQLLQETRQQVTEAFEQLQSAKQQITLQRRLVEQEKQRYAIARDEYEQGYLTSIDLNSTEKDITAAELTLQRNYIEWLQSKLKLDYATGNIQTH